MEETMFFSTGNYIQSLIEVRHKLIGAPDLLKKLDEVIMLELELAALGAKKAKSEVTSKDNIRPIK